MAGNVTIAGGMEYRVRATNSARESENKIHDDALAARYGFRGGLVPGVTVYGYMTVPVVRDWGRAWLEHGGMSIKFLQPFYEGETVVVRARPEGDDLVVTAEDEQGAVRATGRASLAASQGGMSYPERPLPPRSDRPQATEDNIQPGRILGSLHEPLRIWHETTVQELGDPLGIYDTVVHPKVYLSLANEFLVANYRISPWIHTASEVAHRGVAFPGDTANVRGAIRECYERKGHKMLALDMDVTAGGRQIAAIRHTAIWKLREE